MSQVIVDPRELKVFARTLEAVADGALSRKNRAASRLASLHETWRDQKYASYEKTFEQTAVEIDKFVKMAFAYAQYLDHKAALAEKYLGRL